MDEAVKLDIHHIIDQYIDEQSLNSLLKDYVEDKAREETPWSLITLCTHDMLGGNSPRIVRHAAVTELAVLALDIVDDLQDQDNPEKPWMTTPREYTLNAILSFLIACMGECGPEAVPEMSRLLAHSVNGQQRDLNGSVQTEADYIEMVRRKSGSLIRLACQLGYSLVPDADPDQIRLIDELAGSMGIVAQLDNDIRDVCRIDQKNDLLQKKRTLPILFMLQYCGSEFPLLEQYYEGKVPREELLANKRECIDYIHSSGCLEYSRAIQDLYRTQAEECYNKLDALSPWKERFKDLTLGPTEPPEADEEDMQRKQAEPSR